MRVDWDLLADHLGGALTGTPRDAEVAELIATDPSWAQAATDLSGAFESVHAELARLDRPAMPDDITDRLDGVLRDLLPPAVAVPASGTTGAPAAALPDDPRVPSPRRSTRPGSGRPRPTGGPSRRRSGRRLAQWSAGAAAAAGVVAFAAIGLGGLQLPNRSAGDSAEAGAAAPDTLDAPPQPIVQEPDLAATGTDYRAGGLASPPPQPAEDSVAPPENGTDGGPDRPDPGRSAPEVAAEPVGPLLTVPPALDRLWSDQLARDECLTLAAGTVEPPPVTITVVDFAHFRGEPALVIWITAGDGAELVRVVGPACGTPDAGADLLYQTPPQ